MNNIISSIQLKKEASAFNAHDGCQHGPEITIDLTYLKTFSAGDKEFEKDMLVSSISDIDQKMLELKKAFAKKKPVLIKIASHSLKSLSSIAGISNLYNIINDIEKDCANATIEQYTAAEGVWRRGRLMLNEIIQQTYS